MAGVHSLTAQQLHVLVRTHGFAMQAELHGVMPVHKGEFQVLQKSALQWGNRLKQAVAVCNSLNMVNKTTVGGNDMERAMFKAVEARFLVSSSRLTTAAASYCASWQGNMLSLPV